MHRRLLAWPNDKATDLEEANATCRLVRLGQSQPFFVQLTTRVAIHSADAD